MKGRSGVALTQFSSSNACRVELVLGRDRRKALTQQLHYTVGSGWQCALCVNSECMRLTP
jgi:hypothetical protein